MLFAAIVRSTPAMGRATLAALDADDSQMMPRTRAAHVGQP
jgi:hypothetical protein